MKLFLASFFESDNHGPGRKISIATGVPKDKKVDCVFELLIPEGMNEYYKTRFSDSNAGQKFEESYTKQLSKLYNDLTVDSKTENLSFEELLPFKDGDTLLSWEKSGNMSYRKMVNDFLVKLGYEVVLK